MHCYVRRTGRALSFVFRKRQPKPLRNGGALFNFMSVPKPLRFLERTPEQPFAHVAFTVREQRFRQCAQHHDVGDRVVGWQLGQQFEWRRRGASVVKLCLLQRGQTSGLLVV